ncbi:hypothetical protein HJC23_007206 [Cyclotella cryptica]|uniref:Plastid lipid-associated protein/fibrillin conserved domain-containing protein n=1 Tax=Cyclotella cryptica TaxID=29204 RepID=A0ABD3QR14_9STRA|eukprot:CCRYP_003491-RA/>CCRYP_003491-RA protein AED:0.19 eAED:0.19 QI:216/1/1/1/1/1/2/1222/298
MNIIATTALFALVISLADALLSNLNSIPRRPSELKLKVSLANLFSPQKTEAKSGSAASESDRKSALLDLLAQIPPNEATPRDLTLDILKAVMVLEIECPTPESDVLPMLAGNWKLVWTAQDASSIPKGPHNILRTWINPLENQAYSNNPFETSGRSNPILPQQIQNNLEEIGVLKKKRAENIVISTQAIDLKRNRIRNVVAFEASNPTICFSNYGKTRGRITVDIKGSPNIEDKRRIDVKFDECRLTLFDSPIDLTFPLGFIGPTGWLRTIYVDNEIRITRGHKGSVFILLRSSGKLL